MNKIVRKFFIGLYNILEHMDGEKGFWKMIPYTRAQRLKIKVLKHIS